MTCPIDPKCVVTIEESEPELVVADDGREEYASFGWDVEHRLDHFRVWMFVDGDVPTDARFAQKFHDAIDAMRQKFPNGPLEPYHTVGPKRDHAAIMGWKDRGMPDYDEIRKLRQTAIERLSEPLKEISDDPELLGNAEISLVILHETSRDNWAWKTHREGDQIYVSGQRGANAIGAWVAADRGYEGLALAIMSVFVMIPHSKLFNIFRSAVT